MTFKDPFQTKVFYDCVIQNCSAQLHSTAVSVLYQAFHLNNALSEMINGFVHLAPRKYWNQTFDLQKH